MIQREDPPDQKSLSGFGNGAYSAPVIFEMEEFGGYAEKELPFVNSLSTETFAS
jgi:hypothetical protein